MGSEHLRLNMGPNSGQDKIQFVNMSRAQMDPNEPEPASCQLLMMWYVIRLKCRSFPSWLLVN